MIEPQAKKAGCFWLPLRGDIEVDLYDTIQVLSERQYEVHPSEFASGLDRRSSIQRFEYADGTPCLAAWMGCFCWYGRKGIGMLFPLVWVEWLQAEIARLPPGDIADAIGIRARRDYLDDLDTCGPAAVAKVVAEAAVP